jgi:chemosensory pili system protein ChpA (sensor histidine kinase/response regulator)
MNSTSLDLGPLSWVKTEIEHSLAEARTNLDKLVTDTGDTKALKYVLTHLHQVAGALSMVGLGAATRFTEEIESLVATLEDPAVKPEFKTRIELAKEATGSLSNYLDSLMSGEPDRPMSLAPSYVALNRGRGAKDASESDLFSPDLTTVIPMADDTIALPKSEMLIEAIKQRRNLYQAGLLKLLREKDLVGGARDMRNATLAIEALQLASPTRAFWYTASGFFDAVAANPAESGALAVQLFGKIDQQIKLLIEGVQKVPEKLFRDLLLVIGKSKATTERARAIRSLYRLDELLAAAPLRDGASDESVRTLVRSIRDQVSAMKENWLKFTSGNRAALDAFAQQGEVLAKTSQQLPNQGMAELLRVIGLVGSHLKKTGAPANEIQAIEVATALLFVESSLENFARLSPEFSVQSQGIVGRIKGAMSGSALPALDASTNAMMDDFTKRAQERLLMFQVGQEVQVNLSTIESTLDTFFRDPMKTAELASLPPLFSQVQGALSILELDEAAALNQILRDRVVQFSSGALKGGGEDAEAVAEGISALGLFVSALQQSAADPREALLPALIRFGLAQKPVVAEKSVVKAPVSQADVEVDKQKVQALYADWKQQPEATTTREQLREAVVELKQNAEVTGDTASAKSSEATLKAIDASFDPLKTGMTEAFADIAPAKPTDAPTPQVVQLIDAPAAEVDQELLDIFLEEANEVVVTIRDNLVSLRGATHDREALTTIRRGFHTLKGSGRMVGLNDLGEVAWGCEQVMNKWLKDEKSVSAGLMTLIDESVTSFGHWVTAMQANGTAKIDGRRIGELCELLKNDREPVVNTEIAAAPRAVANDVKDDTKANTKANTKADTTIPAIDNIVDAPFAFVATPDPLVDATAPVTPHTPIVPVENIALELPAFNTAAPILPTTTDKIDILEVPAIAEDALLITPAADLAATSDVTVEALSFEPYSAIEMPATQTSVAPIAVDSLTPDLTPSIEMPAVADAASDTVFAELPAIAVPPEMPAEVVRHDIVDDDAVSVGHVRLPMPLYEIYLGEASQHVETLDGELSNIEANPLTLVSHEFMRAAHTLNSSSRATGFESIADVAAALEKWLHDAIELVPEFTVSRIEDTRQAVDALAGMVLSLHMHEYPAPRTDMVDALVSLRGALKSDALTGHGTHLKKPRSENEYGNTTLSKRPSATSAEMAKIDTDASALFAISANASDSVPVIDTPPEPSVIDVAPAVDLFAVDVPKQDETHDAPAPEVLNVAPQNEVPDFSFLSVEPAVEDVALQASEAETLPAVDIPKLDAPAPDVLEVADAAPQNEVPDFSFLSAEPAVEDAVLQPSDAQTLPEIPEAKEAETPPPVVADVTPEIISEPPPVALTETTPPAVETAKPSFDPADVFGIATVGALAATAAAFIATPTPATPVAPALVPAPAPVPTPAPAPIAAPAIETEAFESGRDRRAVKDDIDIDLLPIFLEEAREISPQVGDALRRWKAAPGNHSPVGELARHLHTLKGSARMAGLMRLGELAHVMETRIIDMDRVTEPAGHDFDAIDDRLDRFNVTIEKLAAGDLAPIIEIPIESVVSADVSSQLPAPMAAIAAARAEIVAEGEKLEGRERQAVLRVNADLIDRLVNDAGELAIARSRVDLELQAFKKALLDLNDNVARMKVQLREIEIGAESQIQSRIKEAETQGEQFDPLEFDRFSRMQELTRFMAESLNDVVTLQQSLAKNIDEADAALLQQNRLNRDLQQGLMGVRLVPLGNLQDRFYRLVRQTAKELEKKANLEFRGVRVEIDRSVLEKITAPFEHLLRNAVAHGLEMPAQRQLSGKSEIGEISIDARQIGNEVVLTLADDGAGLNFKRIREKAIEKGMLAPDAEVSDAQLTQFIFAAGFSTADSVTQLAGRGVGMDVVRNEIVSLGGRVDITSTPNLGTTFTIALPLTLAVTQAVMVTVGETTYAIPSVMIEQVQEFKGKRYEPLLTLNEIEWKGNKYPLRSMEVILGGKAKVSAQRHAFVILAKSGQQRAAVQVDDILGNREIVVKSIGPQLARIPGIAGATVLGSGQVVLIMNPVQLVFREATTVTIEQNTTIARTGAPLADSTATSSSAAPTATSSERTEQVVPVGATLADAIAANAFDDSGFTVEHPVRTNPLVMVVDDSLTVRKITSRMLTRENFEVATAKDGVDGLQQLQDIEPDIILLDIEMPRMDGFEFARNVRADPKTRHIPIIMITSRTADKHRNHAMELGVNEYMGKPYQEEQLLAMIRQYTRQQAAA